MTYKKQKSAVPKHPTANRSDG